MNATPPMSTEVDEQGETDGTMIEAQAGDLSCAAAGMLLAEEDNRRLLLAQRLHRDVAGGLVVCATLSEMALMSCEEGDDRASIKDAITKLEASLKEAVQVVREITEQQYPLALKAFGLVFALDKFAASMTESAAAEISVSVEGNEFALPLEKRLSVYRILEALTVRCVHTGMASMVSIHCRFSDSALEFLLLHDGEHAIVTNSEDDVELGWIKARISVLPGQLFVSSADPDGPSTVRLLVPVSVKS